MDPKSVNQITLRVNPASELGLMLNELVGNDRVISESELQQIGGLKRSAWLVKAIGDQFDNISVTIDGQGPDAQYKVRYFAINGTPVQAAVAQAAAVQAAAPQPDLTQVEKLRWPDPPPVISESDSFREPGWFGKMEKMVEAGKNIIISGPPGVGKDTAIEQLSARHKMPLVNIGADAGLRKRDLIGTLQIVSGSSFIEVAEYAAAVVNGWWANISEINAADPDSLMLLNTQLAPPYIINIGGQTYRRHPNFRLFASYNPNLIGTKPLPQALKDRFFPIKLGFHTTAQLSRILIANGMPEYDPALNGWPAKVVRYGMEMWASHEAGRMRFQITTRRLIDAVAMMNIGVCSDVREALHDAVIDAIDSPIEVKVAETVLTQVVGY